MSVHLAKRKVDKEGSSRVHRIPHNKDFLDLIPVGLRRFAKSKTDLVTTIFQTRKPFSTVHGNETAFVSIMKCSLTSVLNSIRCGDIRNVVVMTGAGVSTNAGIPDFRSPNGMYSTIDPDLLTATAEHRHLMKHNPTAVADIRLFERNPLPYLEIRRSFILGSLDKVWKPTISHCFAQVLYDKQLLRRVYTQNTDGLDHDLKISHDKIVNFHGRVNTAECTFCKAPYPTDLFYQAIKSQIRNIYDANDIDAPSISTPILCLKCKRAGVKPSVVLFGQDIPRPVNKAIASDFPDNVDLLIIAGTSLTVSPACHLVNKVFKHTPKILINNELVLDEVGNSNGTVYDSSRALAKDSNLHQCIMQNSLHNNARSGQIAESDTHNVSHNTLLGPCDEGFLTLAKELGWLKDLYAYKDLLCDKSAHLLDLVYKQ